MARPARIGHIDAVPRNRFYQGPPSDHFDGVRFSNPRLPPTDKSLVEVARWKLSGGAARWPATVAVTPARPAARVDALTVTMVGHATLLIQTAGRNILTDPVWANRAGPLGLLGPKRVTAPGIGFDDLPPIDAVLVSHSHYDHLDVATLRRLRAAHDPLIVAPLGVDTVIRAAVPGARVTAGDWGDRIAISDGVATSLTPAQHWSARGPRDRRMTLWAGHYLHTPTGSVWFAGDTGLGDGAIFAEIATRHRSPDLALIPIGAYAPRWFMAAQHLDPADAVRVLELVDARRALGIHWGTFQLTDEPRDEPVALLADAVAARGIAADRFTAAVPGGVYTPAYHS